MSKLNIRWLVATAALAALAVMLAPTAPASRSRAEACNLRGSWVASTAETKRWFQVAFKPRGVLTGISLERGSGSLVATFTRSTFTLGATSLRFVGQAAGRLNIEEEVDLEAVAPYRVRGRQVVLAPGTYKVTVVRAVVRDGNAGKPFRAPNTSVRTTAWSPPYSCTPQVLRLKVRAGESTFMMKFNRER